VITGRRLSNINHEARETPTCVRPYKTQIKGKGGKKQAYSKHFDEQCRMNTVAEESFPKERSKQRKTSVRGVAGP
jgi:hypothetical protein